MRDNSLFGQRSMPKLSIKIKLVVFYVLKKDKDILNELSKECNTSTCQYSIIPVSITLNGGSVSESFIKKYIRSRILGYKKDFDKVFIINPNICQSDAYIAFDSVDSFKTWLENI